MGAELSLITAFLIGLLGSLHCAGMCGGIVGVLGADAATTRRGRNGSLAIRLAYNAGRIASYAVAGSVAGLLGGRVLGLLRDDLALNAGLMISGGFMIALGLYLAGWWLGLAALERQGRRLLHRLEPLGRRLFPVRGVHHAFAVGLVWGWLPCGLVYSTLAWSLSAASAVGGAALMICFGLGTLPMLLAMGLAARQLLRLARAVWVRRAVGTALIAYGALTFTGVLPPGAEHAAHTQADGVGGPSASSPHRRV